jgi:hypothetical protein
VLALSGLFEINIFEIYIACVFPSITAIMSSRRPPVSPSSSSIRALCRPATISAKQFNSLNSTNQAATASDHASSSESSALPGAKTQQFKIADEITNAQRPEVADIGLYMHTRGVKSLEGGLRILKSGLGNGIVML